MISDFIASEIDACEAIAILYIGMTIASLLLLNSVLDFSCRYDEAMDDIKYKCLPKDLESSGSERKRLISALRYYGFLRKEIEREDNITNQRLTWSITFQGFLVGAMGFLLNAGSVPALDIVITRKTALAAIGAFGILVAALTLKGVYASRLSIAEARVHWEHLDKNWKLYPDHVPQTFGQGSAFDGGNQFAIAVPKAFILMWWLYLVGYLAIVIHTWLAPCLTQPGRMAGTGSELTKCLTSGWSDGPASMLQLFIKIV